jgi:hypothetical protein
VIDNRAFKWRQYKADFLKANRCTDDEFEQAYIIFMESDPDEKAYRQFARKWQIRIIPEPNLPSMLQCVLSVNVSAMKVMAKTHLEAENAIAELLSDSKRKQ